MNKLLATLLTIGTFRYMMAIGSLVAVMAMTIIPTIPVWIAHVVSWCITGILALGLWIFLNKSLDNYFSEIRSQIAQKPVVINAGTQTERPQRVLTAVGENGFIERDNLRRTNP